MAYLYEAVQTGWDRIYFELARCLFIYGHYYSDDTKQKYFALYIL